jgi:hypothetical protein
MLRYVSETEATVWVETDQECEVEVLGRRVKTFAVAGHHYGLVVPAAEPPLAAILAALRTLSLIRLLAQWEQGIADTLLARAGIEFPGEEDRLRATVTACAATSALQAAAQVYRGRYPGPGLDTQRLLPIIEQAFAVLLTPSQ